MDVRPGKLLKQTFACFLVLLLVTLTACWDSKNIEGLSFVLGIALDLKTVAADSENESNRKTKMMEVTHQFIIPKSALGEGSPGQKPYVNFSSTGYALHEMMREVSLKTQPIRGSHTKVIVIGDKLARSTNIQNLLEFYYRDEGIRESCIVIISRGSARDALEVDKTGQIPANRLTNIADNQYRTIRLVPKISLQNIISKLTSDTSFILQSANVINKDIKFTGAAVIKGKTDKLVGYLSGKDVKGLTWLMGTHKGGVLSVENRQHQTIISYEVRSMKSKITPRVKGDRIAFDVEIESTGRISEDWREKADNFKDKSIKQAENLVKEEAARLVKGVLNKMQNVYHVDVAGFGKAMRIHHPKLWEQMKGNWDEEFSRSDVKFTIKINIDEYQLRGTKK